MTHGYIVRPPGAPVSSLKRQAKSLMASATGWVGEKSGGSIAGTPPNLPGPLSHTAAVGLSPSGRDTSICRSGKTVGSLGFQLKALLPRLVRIPPERASITSEKL